MQGKKVALISEDGSIEIINNGLKENEYVKVSKELSSSQINRINELTDFKKFTKEMGGFIHLIYVKSELLFKDIIDGATISRFLYLATYIDWNNKEENVLKMDSGEYMSKRDMCYILKISNDTFKRMYKELLDNNLIFEANDKIYISNEYISKGKIKKNSLEGKDYCRLFIKPVREIYENCSTSQHKTLAIIYKLLPYINFYTNIFTHNRYESETSNLQYMDINDILNILGIPDTKSNRNKVRDKLMSFYIYHQGVKYRIFSETEVKKGNKILIINPLLTWSTEDLEQFNKSLTSVLFLPKNR